MLQFDEYKVKLNNLAPALKELAQALDLDSAERELDMLQAESASDGFWDDLAKAQKIQQRIKNLQTKVDAARLMTSRAAVTKDQGKPYNVYAARAKLLASDVANEVTRGCVQLLGGYGYAREYTVERFMRDAKITEIYEGTSEVMKMVISGSLNLK